MPSREYREKHRDILNAKNREYYRNTIEYQKERSRLYRKNNPKKEIERTKRWRINNPEKAMFQRAKRRAKIKGIEFTITVKDIHIPDICPIFGLVLSRSTTGRLKDNSPSLDRIDSSKGYSPGNIIVISWRANKIKNCGTPDEHIRIGTFFKSYSYDLG